MCLLRGCLDFLPLVMAGLVVWVVMSEDASRDAWTVALLFVLLIERAFRFEARHKALFLAELCRGRVDEPLYRELDRSIRNL